MAFYGPIDNTQGDCLRHEHSKHVRQLFVMGEWQVRAGIYYNGRVTDIPWCNGLMSHLL